MSLMAPAPEGPGLAPSALGLGSCERGLFWVGGGDRICHCWETPGAIRLCLDGTSFENVISMSSSASGWIWEAPVFGQSVMAGEGRRAS